MKYSEFIFESYSYDPAKASLSLCYRFSDGPRFEERLAFDLTPRQLSATENQVLDRIFRLILLVSGISYYKAFIPETLICEAFPLDSQTAGFLREFYEKGLAEFAFKNRLSLRNHIQFQSGPVSPACPIALDLPRKSCVPVGGGKDSIVTTECLKRCGEPVILFSLGDADPIRACIVKAALPSIRVRRRLDSGLLDLNKKGALNGHIPITGIVSAIALAGALLSGCDAIVMSNEHSASAPNLNIDGVEVNHQYSKSLEFELAFSEYIQQHISPSVAYFSLLRPLSEIEIARRFSRYPKYFGAFQSCNTAFKQSRTAQERNWCCDCPKCRFVFLALSPFIAKADLIGIFGCNLLNDESQRDGFAALCGLSEHKPFECVGEVSESAAVMSHISTLSDWESDAVVQQLRSGLAASRQEQLAEYQALFAARHPHRVPDSYLAMLDACD